MLNLIIFDQMDLIANLTARTAGTGPGLYKKQMCAFTFQLHSGCDTYYWKEKKMCFCT